jgi:regulator of protease activity HflC (stomatin/prohibitin superfamily)
MSTGPGGCCFSCGCVREMEAGVVESCGKFNRVVPAGCYMVCCPIERMVRTVSLKIQYLDIACDTKTRDNVFVRVIVAVQYRVMPDKVPSAVYKLTDPQSQIRSYVFDVVRGSVPRLDLDAAFASKDDVANSVKTHLQQLMMEYGYEIVATLVIDIDPNAHVKAAMNDINGKILCSWCFLCLIFLFIFSFLVFSFFSST